MTCSWGRGRQGNVVFKPYVGAGIAMSAIALTLASFGMFPGTARADDPLTDGANGLDQLQGADFGSLTGITDSAPPKASPPASVVEAPTSPASGPASGGDTAPAPVSAPVTTTKPATLQLPSAGTGRAPGGTGAALLASLFALVGVACVAASRRLRSDSPRA